MTAITPFDTKRLTAERDAVAAFGKRLFAEEACGYVGGVSECE